MRLIQLATLLTLGTGSLSVLIPSTVSLDNKIDTEGLSPEAYAITQLTQTLKVPCESCPFNTGKDSFSQTPNNLVLTLSLDPLARDTIFLNGNPLFPFVYTQSAAEPFTVIQKSQTSEDEVKVPVGLDLIIETDEHNVSRLRLHILSVNGFKTQADMEILEFPVFQNKEGEIFIGEVHVRPPTVAEASSVMCKDDVFCRWKAYLFDTLHKITGTGRRKGGCHGKGKGYKRPSHSQSTEQPYHGQQSEHRPHKEHEHKWRWYNWVALVIRIVIACLLIGAITMSIGLFITIAFGALIHILLVTWLFVSGKSRSVRLPVGDEAEQGLMSKDEESQSELVPEYSDDLPVYVENEAKQ